MAEAVSDVTISGYFTAPFEIRARDADGEPIRCAFELIKKGSHFRWRDQPGTPYESVILSNGQGFYHLKPDEPGGNKYDVVIAADMPNRFIRQRMNSRMKRFVFSTSLLWNYRTLFDAWTQKDLVIQSAKPHDTVPRWVEVSYLYSDAYVESSHGTIVLSPDEDWAIRAYEHFWPGADSFKMNATVGVRYAPDVGFFPESYQFSNALLPREGSRDAAKLVGGYDCMIVNAEKEIHPQEALSLAALGAKDPRSSGSFFLFVNLIAVAALLVAMVWKNRINDWWCGK
ncbi:MAG: hypothetical protein AAF662_03880 [Pseudomonadota bacterium]